MSDNTGKLPEGEHIDELLSQLKGIFGHLSESEKEESSQKIVPPSMPPRTPTPPPVAAPAPISEPSSPDETAGLKPEDLPAPLPVDALPVLEDLTPGAPLEPWVASDPASAMAAPLPVPTADGFIPTSVNVPEGVSLLPAVVFHPMGRANEAKIVAEKVERITPKFTKVAFAINVQALATYDVKADILQTIVSQVTQSPTKAVFLLLDKALDEPRRKAIVADLEKRGIYFQEIPFHQVEKKAIYTDMLLGMVFFFDSQKPTTAD